MKLREGFIKLGKILLPCLTIWHSLILSIEIFPQKTAPHVNGCAGFALPNKLGGKLVKKPTGSKTHRQQAGSFTFPKANWYVEKIDSRTCRCMKSSKHSVSVWDERLMK